MSLTHAERLLRMAAETNPYDLFLADCAKHMQCLEAENKRLRSALYDADEGCRYLDLYDEEFERSKRTLVPGKEAENA